MFEQYTSGVIVVDRKGVIRYATPALTTQFRRSPEALVKELLDHPLLLGEPMLLELRGEDGISRVAEACVSETDWEGDKASLMLLSDVTEQKRMEEELVRLASFLEKNPNPIVETDTACTRVTYSNPAAIKAFPDLPSLGVAHPILNGMASIARRLYDERKPFHIREMGVGPQIFEEHIFPFPGSNLLLIYFIDVTQRKQVDRLKNEFVSIVSHELRTPLSIIKEGINLVTDRIPGPLNPEQEKLLSIARVNVDRLTRIISELLDISKIESGKLTVERGCVDMSDVMQRVAEGFRTKIGEKGLAFRVGLPSRKISVYADQDKIIQVLTNLLNNAWKFTEKGSIEMRAEEKDGEALCAVKDTGVGIPQEELPKIFGKFHQVGHPISGGDKGTGLGLSIAKGIIELHEGKIWAESREGGGSTFSFTLPLYTPHTRLREFIEAGVREATEKNTKVSIIAISVQRGPAFKKEMTEERMRAVVRGMGEAIRQSLRRASDRILEDAEEVTIQLVDTNKASALRIGERLEQIVQDYLTREKLSDQFAVRFGYATYPDDGKSDEELLHLARTL